MLLGQVALLCNRTRCILCIQFLKFLKQFLLTTCFLVSEKLDFLNRNMICLQGFKALKSLICLVLFTRTNSAGVNPFWDRMGYSVPEAPASTHPSALAAEEAIAAHLLHLPSVPLESMADRLGAIGLNSTSGPGELPTGSNGDIHIHCDIVIIGSGQFELGCRVFFGIMLGDIFCHHSSCILPFDADNLIAVMHGTNNINVCI